ncbi:MAG: class I SAM-dependent methyltransferase [Candidatus Sumerlaeia bacterium]
MKDVGTAGLKEVQEVYTGAEGELWELIMGEQIHIGGLPSSMDLAKKSGVGPGMRGVDFCCCTGAGMRFLLRFCGVDIMTGVDATERMITTGKERSAKEGFSDRTEFILADVCDSGLSDASADFIWGEDAWCYVVDKEKMIAEAARIVKPGGTIAFTDWVEGPAGMSDDEAKRFLAFMKFPNLQDLKGYPALLEQNGCEMVHTEDTGRFPSAVELYMDMVQNQLTYDVLKIIGFDQDMLAVIGGEMVFMQDLAHAGKVCQGLFVAKKK